MFYTSQNVTFSSPFYSAPVVLTTVINGVGKEAINLCPAEGPLITWLEVRRKKLGLFHTIR